jgi:hypothetical protein
MWHPLRLWRLSQSSIDQNNTLEIRLRKTRKRMDRSIELLKLWITRSSRAAWAPILVFAIHIVLARAFDVYTYFPDIDIPMHFLGGVAITHFLLRCAIVAADLGVLGSPNRIAVALLALLAASTTTILWEFFEWTLDRLLQKQWQLSLDDTLLDMLLGMFGSIVYLALTRGRSRGRSNSTINGR